MQPHDTSPSREYLLSIIWNEIERNRTKRNETVIAVFLESCAMLPFRFYGFLVKRNSIVLNDIGNVFLTRTVHVGPQELFLSVGYGSICMVVCWTMCLMIITL